MFVLCLFEHNSLASFTLLILRDARPLCGFASLVLACFLISWWVNRSVCLPICLSIFLFACLSVSLSVCLRLSLSLSLSLPVHLPAYLPVCLCLSASVYLSVYLPTRLSVYLPVCLTVCLSICHRLYLSLPVGLSACLSICLPINLPVCLPVCLSHRTRLKCYFFFSRPSFAILQIQTLSVLKTATYFQGIAIVEHSHTVRLSIRRYSAMARFG